MRRKHVLLIHPPVVRPCEPPPGLTRLAGSLKAADADCTLIDANIEGLRFLCAAPPKATDTWSRRAAGKIFLHLGQLRSAATYRNKERYRQAVFAVNRVLAMHGRTHGICLSLTDYQDPNLSPLSVQDLAKAFANPTQNIYFPYFSERLEDIVRTGTVDLAGFSLNYLSQAICTFAMIGYLKRLAPGLPVLLGGGLVTSWLRRAKGRSPFGRMVDQVVAGPGEGPLLERLHLVPHTGAPLPDFDHVAQLPYLSPGLVLPFSASSGCWWRRCAFCPEQAEKNPYRPLPLRQTVSQLKTLTARYTPTLIHLVDNALSPALLRRLAADPPGAPWYGFARFTRHLADTGFCNALRKAGCVLLQLGLESGSPKVLERFGKGIDLEIAGRALAALERAGIAVYAYLLFATPWESRVDAEMTLDFMQQHRATIRFLNLAVFNMPAMPGKRDTPTMSLRNTLSLYRPFSPPEGWQRRDVRQFLDKTFKRHPAVAPILRNDPPAFTSSHAPFFACPPDTLERDPAQQPASEAVELKR